MHARTRKRRSEPRGAGRALAASFATWIAAAGLAACASAGGGATEEADAPAPNRTVVQVDNREAFPMRIEINAEVEDHILGQVSPLSSAEFTVPAGFAIQGRQIWLEAHPIGSTEVYRSDNIYPYPGDRIEWTLAGGPAQSRGRIEVRSSRPPGR